MKKFYTKDNQLSHLIFNAETDIKGPINWIGEDSNFLQLGIWKYCSGIDLQKHIHIENKREIERTEEYLIVVRGKVQVKLYDMDKQCIASEILTGGDIFVSLIGGHGFHIISDDTLCYELKNGPFLGVEKDKEKF